MFTGTNYNLITIADFKAIAPEVDLTQYSDPTISGMISSASQRVADYLQYSPLAEDITNELKTANITTDGDLVISPQKLPIKTVASISIKKGATQVDLQITNGQSVPRYNIDYNRRKILFPFGEITLTGFPVFTNTYALRGHQFYAQYTYRAGYDPSELPQTIKDAVVLFMRDGLTDRYNTTGATRIQQGGISLDYGSQSNNSNGRNAGRSKMVVEAERLLNPYRRIG